MPDTQHVPPQNQRIRLQYLVNLASLGLVLLVMLGGLLLKVDLDAQREAQRQLISRGQALQAELQGVLSIGLRNVQQLSTAARDLSLRERVPNEREVSEWLPATMQQGSLTEHLGQNQQQQLGTVFFRGEAGPAQTQDLGVSLELNRLMAWTHAHTPMFVWSYSYRANKQTTSLYPYADRLAMMRLHRALNISGMLDKIFDAGTRPLELAGPVLNPQAKPVWTSVYSDQAGKGLMVSLLQPVYVLNHFWGVVGTDLLLADIQKIVGAEQFQDMRVELVSMQGMVLASNQPGWVWQKTYPKADVLDALKTAKPKPDQPTTPPWTAFHVNGPDWKLLISPQPTHGMNWQTPFYAQLLWVLAIVVLTLLLIGLWFHLYLARPVMHLVNFIDGLSHNPQTAIPKVPLTWMGWFDNLRSQAQDRQRMLSELRQSRDHLEAEVSRRTQSLQDEIRERTALQASLLQARQTAEAANQAKSRFLADMSHEIRTPLNAVIGLAHLVLQGNIAGENRDLVLKILLSGEALLDLLNDILDLSKIEAGKMALSLQALDPLDLARQVTHMFELNHPNVTLELVPNMPDGATVWVMGDLLRLRQVLTNLLSNALKFTEVGSVSLCVSAAPLPAPCASWQLTFEVIDTGIGMTDEQQSRLFQAFEQASSDTWHKYKGTGLGLAISSLLIRAMGAELKVHSQPGVGSRFWFELQCTAALPPATSAVALPPPGASLQGTRVLLVEDNAMSRLVCEGLLKAQACLVTSVHNGQEAIDWLTQHGMDHIDVVLMDVNMPVMGGFEATRCLRAMGCQLPILALTANAFTEDRHACLAAGMNDYLTKPIDPNKLTAAIRGLLRR